MKNMKIDNNWNTISPIVEAAFKICRPKYFGVIA
jgi:hypothetical protein